LRVAKPSAQPSRESRSAIASPIPVFAPVTIASRCSFTQRDVSAPDHRERSESEMSATSESSHERMDQSEGPGGRPAPEEALQGTGEGTITKAGAFWLYAFVALCAIVFFWTIVPETKDRTLEQIEQEPAEPEREPEVARA
jgi:hypothetical protein